MVNMLQISSSKKPSGEKLDDIAYPLLTLSHKKLNTKKPQKEKLT